MPEPKRPLKVFLCHAHADRDAVRALYTRLTNDGVDAWLDKEKLLPGQDWELEIKKAVREADVVVVCLSKQFNQAGFRQKEVRLALDTAMEKPEGEIFIIPARLEECDNLESLKKWHWVDLFTEKGYQSLLRALSLRANTIGVSFSKDKKVLHNKLINPQEKYTASSQQKKGVFLVFIVMLIVCVMSITSTTIYQIGKRIIVTTPSVAATAITPLINLPIATLTPSVAPTYYFQYRGKPKYDTSVSIYSTRDRFDINFSSLAFPSNTYYICQDDAEYNSYLIALTQEDCFRGDFIGWVKKDLFMVFDMSEDINAITPVPLSEEINNNGVLMRLVPAGEFTMGSDRSSYERPEHKVYLDAYYIDKYEVTNKLYQMCVKASVCKEPYEITSESRKNYFDNPAFSNFPVINIDLDMAKSYCEWRGGHLPSEAEWEKSARGTDTRIYPWGEKIDCLLANFGACVEDTLAVGSFEDGKSPFGVFDMAGNVSEWVADLYSSDYYKESPYANPVGSLDGKYYVIRGGSFSDPQSKVTTTYRTRIQKTAYTVATDAPIITVTPEVLFRPYYKPYIGFRCARDLSQ